MQTQEAQALRSVRRFKVGKDKKLVSREKDARIVVQGAFSSDTYIVAAVKNGLRLSFRPLTYSGPATDADGVRIDAPYQLYAGCRVHIEVDDNDGPNDGQRVPMSNDKVFGLKDRMRSRNDRYLTGFVQVPLGNDGSVGNNRAVEIGAGAILAKMITLKIKEAKAIPVATERELMTFFRDYFERNA